MGFFYKHIIHPSLSRVVGRKAWTNNPYLGLVLDADEEDVIADELFRASLAYQDGLYSLPQDEKKAMDYCLKAANKGHAVAQLFMAQWLMKFHDDHNDNVMGWLMKAADQGERQSLYNLGISYHRGDIGGKTDIGKSHICFRASAEKLYGAACARMAVIFLNGEDGIEANKSIAKFWAWEANVNGDKEDGGLLNHLLERDDVDDNKLNWKKVYGEAAEAGERFAYHIMGIAYLNESKEKAIECWEKAASMGCNSSMYNLGVIQQQEEKYEKAFDLFKKPAEFGDEMAQYALANMLYKGLGVEKNVREAWHWNEKSVNFGYTPARYLLSVMCLENSVSEIMPDKVMRGMSYLEQAAQQGYEPAIHFYKNQSQK